LPIVPQLRPDADSPLTRVDWAGTLDEEIR